MDPKVLKILIGLGLDVSPDDVRDDPVPTTCPVCGHKDYLPFSSFEDHVHLQCPCGVVSPILDTVSRQ